MKDHEIVDIWLDCNCCETDLDAIRFGRIIKQRVTLDKKETKILKKLALSMMSAISFLRHSSMSVAPSDKIYNQMIKDYQKNLDKALEVLGGV